jgi:uncharacterized protein (DUF58 family)
MGGRRAGFTTRATCLLAAGVTAILSGLIFGEIDLIRAGVLAAAVPCAAAFVVHRSRVRIANRRRVEPTQAEAGQAVTVHLTVTNRALLRTSALMLEDSLPARVRGKARFVVDPLGGHEARAVSYRIPSLGRGRYRVGPLQMRLSDPFGLIDLTRSFTATSEFLVAPVIDALPPIEPPRSDDLGDSAGSRSVGSHGADDQSTREYRTGDDLRKIHWRSSARTGALMVRQEERPWQGQNTILLDVRAVAHVSSADDTDDLDPRLTSSFEWAVSAVASIGTHVMLAGRKLSLVGDPAAGERLRFGDRARLTDHLAEVRAIGRPDLNQAAEIMRSAARDSTLIAVLGRLDAKALRALAEAHARGRSAPAFALLLDVDTWAAPLDLASGAPPAPPAELDATAAVLRRAGWRVTIVHRGEATAHAWQLLLAGSSSGVRAAVGAR